MNILSTLRDLAIGGAIGILLPLTVNYGVRAVIGNYPVMAKYGYTYNKAQNKWTFSSPEKEQAYEQDKKYHDIVHFYVNITVGIAALIFGIMTQLPFLGIGFIMAGVICLISGYTSYWHYFNDIIRFISLLLALLLLVIMSYRITAKNK